MKVYKIVEKKIFKNARARVLMYVLPYSKHKTEIMSGTPASFPSDRDHISCELIMCRVVI